MKRIKKVFENRNIICKIRGDYVLVEFWTDTAGQDIPVEFTFDGTPEDFVKKFSERAESYDVDDEVEIYVPMRGQRGVPSRVIDIVADCQEAKNTLTAIAAELKRELEKEPIEPPTEEQLKTLSDAINICDKYHKHGLGDELLDFINEIKEDDDV